MTRSMKLEPLPQGFRYVDPRQAQATQALFGPSIGVFPGNPNPAKAPMPSLIPPPDGAPIANGLVRQRSPYGDIESLERPIEAAWLPPETPWARAFAPDLAKGVDLQNFQAMPPFGQPNSPLHAITAAQQKTPQAPPQSAQPQPLAPAGPDPGATGMSTSPSLAGSGPRRFEPPPKTA